MKGETLLLGAILSGSAFAFNLDLSAGVWSQSPEGSVQYPRETGDRIDLKDTLGLGKEVRPFARLKLEVPILPNVYLSYFPSKFSGTNTIPYTVTYGDYAFDSAVEVKSEVKINRYDGILYYNLPFLSSLTKGILEVELGVGVRYFVLEGTLTGRDVNLGETITETAKEEVPLPVAYASATLNVPTPFVPFIEKLSLYGEGRGIAYSSSHYYQVGGELRMFPLKNAYLFGGFVLESLKVDEQDVDLFADVKVKGFFAGAGLSF